MLHDYDMPELRKARRWTAVENFTSPSLQGGFRALSVAGGTATAVPYSSASRSGRLHRLRWISAATAGSIITLRVPVLEYSLSDSFSISFRFKISDAADVTGARMFIGCRSSGLALTNVDPGTLTNAVGIGHNSGETTLRVYGADATPGTPVDLGADFPSLGSFEGFVDFSIVGQGVDGAFWRAYAWHDSVGPGPLGIASGKFARAPGFTQALVPLTAFRTNNATAAAVALDLSTIHISTL